MCTVYQRCPFCERVFELGSEEYEPMKLHLGLAHGGPRTNGPRVERALG